MFIIIFSLFLCFVHFASGQTQCSVFKVDDSFVLLEDGGRDSIRIRVFPSSKKFRLDLPTAFTSPPICNPSDLASFKQTSTFSNGDLSVGVDEFGTLKFSNTKLQTTLLTIPWPRFTPIVVNNTDWYALSLNHALKSNESIFGLGQHRTGVLNNAAIDHTFQFQPHNTEIFIPFFSSSLKYGVLFNLPSFGNLTITAGKAFQWNFQNVDHLDFWVTTNSGNYFWQEMMQNYVDATGHSPVWPYFTTGFWQSKNRYRNQTEILDVANEFKSRDLNLSIIIIDYFNWLPHPLGDETLSSPCWPDAKAMSEQLSTQNVKVMVSPYFHAVDPTSVNFDDAVKQRLLVLDTEGNVFTKAWEDSALYDVFIPEARKYLFDKVSDGMIEKFGISLFWLDADEPALMPSGLPDQEKIDDLIWYNHGQWPSTAVGAAYPHLLHEALFDGLTSKKLPPVMLSRSGWAGTQRFGGGIWSGDIPSTFESLQIQFRAALNIQLSGITYWTTDIGGYGGGDITDPNFRELIVRWFQFGLFCPLFRIHGSRSPTLPANQCGKSGASNEIWNFGEESYNAIRKVMEIRESLRPYIHEQYKINSETGMPISRPLFVDFPDDDVTFKVDDQAMFGSQYLIAPQLESKKSSRRIYLPKAAKWQNFFSHEEYEGGQWIEVSTSLDEFPLFVKM